MCFAVVQPLSHVQLFETPWTAAHQTSLSSTISWSLLKLMSIESAMQPSHPLLSPSPCAFSLSQHQGLFQWKPFPMSRLITSGGQSIGASASPLVLPMNTQDWSPLGWTGWILQSKGLSRVFSNTTFMLSAKEFMHLNYGAGESLGLQDPTSPS